MTLTGSEDCCSVANSCLTLCDFMDCRMPGFPVLHYLPDFAQTYITESVIHPIILSSVIPFSSCIFPSIRVFPVSGLFILGGQSIRASASVLLMNIQGWFSLGLTGLISLLSKEFSRVFCSTTVQKHQFFATQPSLWSNSHIYTRLPEKPQLWLDRPLSAEWCLCFLICCLGLL